MPYSLATLKERPNFTAQIASLHEAGWPAFMLNDPVAARYWQFLFTLFTEYQVVLYENNDQLTAAGNTIPLVWDGTEEGLPQGWDAVLEQGVKDHEQGRTPNVLSALSMVIDPQQQGKGLSSIVLQAMRKIAAEHGFRAMIAPVRPNLKSRYPLTPMEDYICWTQEDNLPFDPWLRVHARLGARILRVAHRSMIITGTVAEWETWTGMRFPQSGTYVIPGTLQTILIDREQNEGRYEEPN